MTRRIVLGLPVVARYVPVTYWLGDTDRLFLENDITDWLVAGIGTHRDISYCAW